MVRLWTGWLACGLPEWQEPSRGSHFAETLLGIGPHLDSLWQKPSEGRGSATVRSRHTHVKNCALYGQDRGGELHLFTHADLHYGVADQRFTQIFVFLLLEPLDVFPGRPHKLPGKTAMDTDLQVNEIWGLWITQSSRTGLHRTLCVNGAG